MNCYLYLENQTHGPMPAEKVAQLLETRQILPETPCCREGDTDWSTAAKILMERAKVASALGGPGRAPTPYHHSKYLLRKKFFKLFGQSFRIFDSEGKIAFFSELKAFKLKEDIRIYTGEDKQMEVFSIKARKILDISSTYDVYDSSNGTKIGALRRKGLKSIFRDEWVIMDMNDSEIGTIKEDSLVLGLIRRWVPLADFLPQKFEGEIQGDPVVSFQQNWNIFIPKIELDFSKDTQGTLDRRLGISAAILLSAIEGRQN